MGKIVNFIGWTLGVIGFLIIIACIVAAIVQDPTWAIVIPILIATSWGMAHVITKLADRG